MDAERLQSVHWGVGMGSETAIDFSPRVEWRWVLGALAHCSLLLLGSFVGESRERVE